MRHAISSFLDAISSTRIVRVDGDQGAMFVQSTPMVRLELEQLRNIAGGDDNLPKGGWIAAAATAV